MMVNHSNKIKIYKPDHVLQFFVHYATVTKVSAMGKPEIEAKGRPFVRRYDPKVHSRYIDEKTEATMLHTVSSICPRPK